jgi:DNA-binding IclR family transcriptional regulator
MGRALDPKKIKSAQRVLEVLEYFNAERQEGTVMDIARTYGYPQSSTSELLSCLVALGYLHRDLRARTYRPSARVAVLGAWVQPELFRKGSLLPMMDDLANESGATVVLAARIGLGVQYFHTVDPTGATSGLKTGDSVALLHSAPGKTLLATAPIDQVRKLVHRLNAECDEAQRVRADDMLAEIEAVRARGYAIHADGETTMVSVLLPQSNADEQLALCISAPSAAVEADEAHFVQMLRAAVARQLRRATVEDVVAADAVAAQPEPVTTLFRRFG